MINSEVNWSDVARYRALDAQSGEVLADVDVSDVPVTDARLHCLLKRPADLVVELELKANDVKRVTPSEEGSSQERRVPVLDRRDVLTHAPALDLPDDFTVSPASDSFDSFVEACPKGMFGTFGSSQSALLKDNYIPLLLPALHGSGALFSEVN